MTNSLIDNTTSIQELSMNLASINSEFRKVAISELHRVISTVNVCDFRKLSTGLFYFFWFSDGPVQQDNDRNSIVSLLDKIESSRKLSWVQSLLSTFMELWQTMDRLRHDKYLSLLKSLTIRIYSNLAENWPADFGRWNDFLSSSVVHDDKRPLIRFGLRSRVAFRPS